MAFALPPIKFRVPASQPDRIERQRLVAELDRAARQGIACIHAPAGSGKTTLAGDWCRQLDGEQRAAWITVDAADNDPSAFLRSLAAAIDAVLPGAGREALRLTSGVRMPPPHVVAAMLVDRVSRTPIPITLVLDDVHRITQPAVHCVLTSLLDALPQALRVVLISRPLPDLPLARWRRGGRLAIIDQAALCFRPAETAKFLRRTMWLRISDVDVRLLTERTEGWITGIRLAAVAFARARDLSRAVRSFAGSDRIVQEYLVDELLADQPGWLVSFLMETAVLGRLCAPLCDAVRGLEVLPGWPSPSEATIAAVERAGLFLTPIDGDGGWYRYHPLFAEALVALIERQAPSHVHELRRRASRWFDANRRIDAIGAGADAMASERPVPIPPVRPVKADPCVEPLTHREREVLRHIGTGASNREIADELFISPATAKKHTSNVIAKLGVRSRAQAIARAHALGLL